MCGAEALKRFRGILSQHEEREVVEYPEVWCVGKGSGKLMNITRSDSNNFGYDDDNGDYRVVIGDHLGYRYEVQSELGKGSFGQVLKCHDKRKDLVTAVKLIRNKKRFHKQAQIEVKLLKYVKQHDPNNQSNIIHLMDTFLFRNHLCIVFECMSLNLYELIKNNNYQGLSMGLIRRFAQQMLTGLKTLRKLRIIHCDLKPENVLLCKSNSSAIKIIDLGSSCFDDEVTYTYIQSRFYRAPEVILGLPYDGAIDMWSFGCILAELFMGYPVLPGENEMEQLACMMEVLGLPPQELVNASNRKKMFFDSQGQPRIVANSKGKKRRPATKDLSKALGCKDKAFLSFIKGCLRWDKRERLTPEQAMQHEWLQEALQPLPPASNKHGGPAGLPPINKPRR